MKTGGRREHQDKQAMLREAEDQEEGTLGRVGEEDLRDQDDLDAKTAG